MCVNFVLKWCHWQSVNDMAKHDKGLNKSLIL